eukprot:g1039.t1
MRRLATFAVKNYGKRISLGGYSRSFPRKNQGLWHTLGARPSTPRFLHRKTLKRAVSFSPEIPTRSSNFVFQCLFVSSIVLYTSYKVYENEGLKRSMFFWRRAFPIYLHYRLVEWQVRNLPEAEQDKRFNALHDMYAPIAMDIILDMGGFYIKIGQMGSVRDDFVPPQYMKGLKTLQNDVPFQPADYVKSLITEQLGVECDEIFSEIDEIPLGSASIGQVHRAVLADSGREVVVKVQYPNVEDTFRWDMSTIMDFCKLAQPIHVPFLRECEKQFMTEFDYRLEAQNLKLVGKNLRRSRFSDRVVVPRPIEKYCRRKVLVMEYLKGTTLFDAVLEQARSVAAERNMSLESLIGQESAFDAKDKLWGSKSEIRLYQIYRKSCDYFFNFLRLVNNFTIGAIFGYEMELCWSHLPINVPAILEDLWLVHGYELFVNGAFNGDPHPGNILLLENGKLGLIDYGQVKTLSLEDRLKIAKLIVALGKGDKNEIVQVMVNDHQLKTKYMDPYVIYKLAEVGWNRDDMEITEGKNIQLFLEYLGERDPVVDNNDELIMASRMCVMLRAMSMALRYPIEPAVIWLPFAKELIRSNSSKS